MIHFRYDWIETVAGRRHEPDGGVETVWADDGRTPLGFTYMLSGRVEVFVPVTATVAVGVLAEKAAGS